MSLLGGIFSGRHARAAILADIGPRSVAGAFVLATSAGARMVYAKRLPVEARADESREAATSRALAILGEALVREGAPALQRAGGANARDILIAVDSPWQELRLHTERFEKKVPFSFSSRMLSLAREKARAEVPEGLAYADDSVLATTLNGYDTKRPLGKEAHRAEVIVLASFLNQSVVQSLHDAFASLFHTRAVKTIASGSLRYQAMRAAFPFEENALIVDSLGERTTIFHIRSGMLSGLSETEDGAPWGQGVVTHLAELAKLNPLPRTIFLLASAADGPGKQQELASAGLASLWLADSAPRVVSVSAGQAAGPVALGDTLADMPLGLMARFWLLSSGPYTVPKEAPSTETAILSPYAKT